MIPKKLLVLDVNGLLIDTYFHKGPLPEESPDARVGNFLVYRRPFCEEFLKFCLENFIVGIWSSAREHNVNNLVDYVFGDAKERLAFSWHQSDCTDVGLKAPDNKWKPLFMKELSKLWRKVKVDLPWSEGDYGPSNTLLVDDTPYKAVLNPPNTGIFPRSYTARDHGDTFLQGALRSYLEGIRDAENVQIYVENNPFGEPSISPESPLWSHISKVFLRVQNALNEGKNEIGDFLPVGSITDDISKEERCGRLRQRKWEGYLNSSQLMNFPSEAIELQSIENMVKTTESVVLSELHELDAAGQVHGQSQSGNEIDVLLGPLDADKEQCKDEQSVLKSSYVDYGKNDVDGNMSGGVISFMKGGQAFIIEQTVYNSEQANGEAGTAIALEDTQEQAFITEQTFYNSERANGGAGTAIALEDTQEQQGDKFDGYGIENGQELYGQSGFDPSNSDLQVEASGEQTSKYQDLTMSRDVNSASMSPNFGVSHDYPDGSRGKRRMSHREYHHKSRNTTRDPSGYDLNLKRRKECYQGHSRHDYNYGHNGKRQRGWYHGSHTDNTSYCQNWKRRPESYQGVPWWRDQRGHERDQRGHWRDQRGHERDQRGHSRDQRGHRRDQRGHPTETKCSAYKAKYGYRNSDTSFNSHRRHSQQKYGDRPADISAEYLRGSPGFSNTRVPWNVALDSNLLAQSYESGGGSHVISPNVRVRGHFQDRRSKYQWDCSSEQVAVYRNSNFWSERTEDVNMNEWHLDSTSRDGGASSEPHRNVGAFNHSCRSGNGASRISYRSVGGASSDPYREAEASSESHLIGIGASRPP